MNEIDVAALLEKKIFGYHRAEGTDTYNFIVVGAGGTGGYLIPHLARMVSIKNKELRRSDQDIHQITIIDADDVEDKNLTRQQFVTPDIGKNKAEVMAKRYGRGFGESIAYVDSYVENSDQLLRLMKQHSSHTPVLIDCVDNNKTRLIMKEAYELYALDSLEAISISSGNEERAGQVIFSYRNKSSVHSVLDQGYSTVRQTPDLFDIFPTAEVGKLPTELSCAESAVSHPQNIATNMTAANIIFGLVNKLLNFEAINELAIFFDTSSMGQSVYQAKQSDVVRLLKMTPNNKELFRYLEESEIDFDKADAVEAPATTDAVSVVVEEKKVLYKAKLAQMASAF